MRTRVVIVIAVILAALTPSYAANNIISPEQMIAQCEQKSGENRFHLHRCLLQQYEVLQKKTDILTDKLLGMVGAHRSLGRMKIIQWSNAISKSQSRWQKLIPWDCEWESHILPSAKGGSVAIDRCGIKRAARRVQLLEKRVKTLNTVLISKNQKDK